MGFDERRENCDVISRLVQSRALIMGEIFLTTTEYKHHVQTSCADR